MSDMDEHKMISVRGRLDAALNQEQQVRLAEIMGEHLERPVTITALDNGTEVGAGFRSPTGSLSGLAGMVQGAVDEFGRALAELRRAVVEVTVIEVLSPREIDRRLAQGAVPDMVDAEQFAELLGRSGSRLRAMATERRAGKRSDFPAEVVPGYWLRSSAEAFAAQPRHAGRPRRDEHTPQGDGR